MPATSKKTEPKPEAKPDSIPITNIQKVGVLRFHAKNSDSGSQLADYIEIKPGETVPVPMRVWENYEARVDVQAMDRVHFVIGGLKPGEQMKTPTAQAQALALREKDIAAREAELTAYEGRLEDARRELEAKKTALHEGH